MSLIIIIIIIVFFIILLKSYRIKYDTIIAFTGGLGSGKSHLSVKKSLKLLKKNRFKVKVLNMKNYIKYKLKIVENYSKIEIPLLYSSIPVRVKSSSFKLLVANVTHYQLSNDGYKWLNNELKAKEEKLVKKGSLIPVDFCVKVPKKYIKKYYEMSTELTDNHLLLQTKLREKCVVFIDEIGSYCSQFEFNNSNAKGAFNEFCRLFRHYTKGGYMVVNDQCSENIVLYVRRRLNTVFNLMNFRPRFKLFYNVQCRNINISEEIKTVVNDDNTEDSMRYLFGVLLSKKTYDTYCYSVRYVTVPQVTETTFSELKKHSLLEISPVRKLPKTK